MDDDETLLGHQDSEEGLGVLDNKPIPRPTDGSQVVVSDRIDESVLERKVQFRKLPLGIWVLEKIGLLNFKPLIR